MSKCFCRVFVLWLLLECLIFARASSLQLVLSMEATCV